jgi:hypothetical protein
MTGNIFTNPRDGIRYRRDSGLPLRCIPNWPLPGQAPQFLSDDPTAEVRPGDICLMVFDSSVARTFGTVLDGVYLGDLNEHSRNYLIARKDPTEDI